MNNKEFQKKYDELIKQRPEYLYQRHLGRITKYKKLDEDTYISCSDVGTIFKRDEHLLLGKWSNRLYDLIEEGDIIKYKELFTFDKWEVKAGEIYILSLRNKEEITNFIKCIEDKLVEFISVVTKEQFNEMEFKIE